METFLIKALQLILSLSILVLVHEFGHFLFARIFKVRVEKFYLFFDPWFSLFKYKPKNSDTEYGIGWLPLGGYCKISGMIDESMDKEQMDLPPQPYEFRSKTAGQRLLIMVGGVLFNFILALFIYSMILFAWGQTRIPMQNLNMGLTYSEIVKDLGFRDGDILYKADGKELTYYTKAMVRKAIDAQTVTVLRGGQEVVISMPKDMMRRLMRDKAPFVEDIRYPMVISDFPEEHSPALAAGMQVNDSIVSINGISILTLSDGEAILIDNKEKEVLVGFYRNQTENFVTVKTDSIGRLGFIAKSPSVETNTYSFFESFPAGIRLGVNTLDEYISDMKYVFTKEGFDLIGGFGTIGGMFPAKWNWQRFWEQTAFLSIILAFMNILPIPALDGGHVTFLIYEVVARRKPSDKFLEYAQITGMIIVFALLLFANGNDLFRLFTN